SLTDPPTTDIHTLSLHDALPISGAEAQQRADALIKNAVLPADEELRDLRRLAAAVGPRVGQLARTAADNFTWLLNWARQVQAARSEEHTSELQSRFDLVCRLLLE